MNTTPTEPSRSEPTMDPLAPSSAHVVPPIFDPEAAQAPAASAATLEKPGKPGKPPVRWLDLAVGLPAVLVALAMAGTLYRGIRRSTLTHEYFLEATQRYQKQDFKASTVAFKRLAAMNPDRADYRLALAMSYEKVGETDRAEALARSLAPIDRRGYPPAQLWLARRILGNPALLNKPRLSAAESYLVEYLKADPNSPSRIEVKALLANLYSATGRYRKARPLLEEASPGRPDLLLALSGICKLLGDNEESSRRASQAIALASKAAEARPDDPRPLLFWANGLALKNEFPAAIAILQKAKPGQADQAVRQSLISLYLAWERSMFAAKADPKQRLAVIEKALDLAPETTALYVRLSELLAVGGETANAVRARLEKLKADGKALTLVDFTLGNDAWNRGDVAEARKLWEKALEIEPKLTLAANNLAFSLAYHEPKDAPRALSLIDKALSVSPNDPRLRGTRGQVLTKLERWKDSVNDLEAAIAAGQNSEGMHGALADAYEHLGMVNQAAEHRKSPKQVQVPMAPRPPVQ
jgi:tetratricopeptide (TPR) repeat protein